jgi:tRNA pseudouridine38-40 synthase
VEYLNSLSKFALIIQYDGRCYCGFQWQKGQPTVQATLEAAIYKITNEYKRVIAASRTDAGVHAKCQVVSFWSNSQLPPHTLVRALNYYLPRDIAVKTAARIEMDFDVRKDAISREYEYRIYCSRTRSPLNSHYAYHVPYELDIDKMNQACQLLIGEQDFASFAASTCLSRTTVKKIFVAGFEKYGETVIFHIVANSFLTHQVRNTVGFLIKLGIGKKSIDELKQKMIIKKFGAVGLTAPAYGLCLIKINYPRQLELKYEDLFN